MPAEGPDAVLLVLCVSSNASEFGLIMLGDALEALPVVVVVVSTEPSPSTPLELGGITVELNKEFVGVSKSSSNCVSSTSKSSSLNICGSYSF